MRKTLLALAMLWAATACDDGSKKATDSAPPQGQPLPMRYILLPHPDDEEQSWTMATQTNVYPVFVLLTRGEGATVCSNTVEWTQSDEYVPVGNTCAEKRLDSWTHFLDAALEPASYVGVAGDVLVWRGARHARVVFSYPDGGLWIEDVVAALERTRSFRGGVLPNYPEGDVVAGGYYSELHNGCVEYTHRDHGVIAWTLDANDFGLPHYDRSCNEDPAAAVRLHLSIPDFNRVIDQFRYYYGWQHPAHWEGWICEDNCIFSRKQSYVYHP